MISIREDEYSSMYVFLSANFAWLALLGASIILVIAEMARRDRTWLAAAFATLLQAVFLFPILAGDNEVLAEWRWFLVAGSVVVPFAFFAAFLGPLRRKIESLRINHPFSIPAISAAALACLGAAAVMLFHRLIHSEWISLYPFAAINALLWVQLILFLLAKSVLLLGGGVSLKIELFVISPLGVLLLLAAMAGGIGIVDGARTARIRGLLNWHCPQLSMLCDLERSAGKEWTKVRRRLSPEDHAIGFVDPNGLPASMAPTKRHNVIWLVADAMRRDYVGCLGAERASTPNIDELARSSTVYENAFSPAPGTGDSMPSILTGLMPNTLAHAAKVPVFLPRLLGRHGYRSTTNMRAKNAQFFSYPVLEGVSMRSLGMREIYKKMRPWTKVDELSVDRLIERMRKAKQPVFEYVHLLATHGPFRGGAASPKCRTAVRSVDLQLGRLVAFLKDAGLWDSTVLFFFSDHGEALGEHGMWAHAQALYGEQTAVPLIAHVPGESPRRVAGPITLTALPSLTMQALGARTIFGKHECDRLVPGLNVEWAVQERQIDGDITWRSIRYPPYVYHDKIADGSEELYQTENDPGEIVDVSDRLPGELDELRALAKKIVDWEIAISKSLD
ncbi:MAG: sulfatase [Proteobacteria bacterium]|nr:sulfatase [Pseudomonadota bacterium]